MAANERKMVVIRFMRPGGARGTLRDQFYFADHAAAACLIDPRAKVAFHFLELISPGLGVRDDFKHPKLAANRAGVHSQRRTYDLRPRAHEPGERSFRTIKSPRNATENISRTFHEGAILPRARYDAAWRAAGLRWPVSNQR
jgi:hypothetical protein